MATALHSNRIPFATSFVAPVHLAVSAISLVAVPTSTAVSSTQRMSSFAADAGETDAETVGVFAGAFADSLFTVHVPHAAPSDKWIECAADSAFTLSSTSREFYIGDLLLSVPEPSKTGLLQGASALVAVPLVRPFNP
jgi:hypothetical protein